MNLFPFIGNLFAKRNTRSAPNGWYRTINRAATTSDNATHVFEATQGPPLYGIVQRGWQVGQGPGLQRAFFLPQITLVAQPTVGKFQTANFIGGGPLVTTADSSPQTQLF